MILSRFVALSVSLIQKVSLLQGNIAKPATVAICCANHCGRENTPIDQDVLTNSPSSTMDWT